MSNVSKTEVVLEQSLMRLLKHTHVLASMMKAQSFWMLKLCEQGRKHLMHTRQRIFLYSQTTTDKTCQMVAIYVTFVLSVGAADWKEI